MNKKLILEIGTIVIVSILISTLCIALTIKAIEIKITSNKVVETYESTLDEISVDYDDDNKQYEVFVNNKLYYVAEDEIKVLPYYKNEVVVEITKNGKCNLIFYIEYIH